MERRGQAEMGRGAGTLTLPGAQLQLLHPVDSDAANTPAHGTLFAFAFMFALLQPDAQHWEPVPAVALCPGLQASIDIGPAGQVRPVVSCPGPRAGAGVPMALSLHHRMTAASGARMRAGPGAEVRSGRGGGVGSTALSRWLPSALALGQTSGSSASV